MLYSLRPPLRRAINFHKKENACHKRQLHILWGHHTILSLFALLASHGVPNTASGCQRLSVGVSARLGIKVEFQDYSLQVERFQAALVHPYFSCHD